MNFSIQTSKFLPYGKEFEENATKKFQELKSNLTSVLVLKDIPQGLHYWCTKLNFFLNSGYPIKKEDIEYLAQLLFEIITLKDLPRHEIGRISSILYYLLHKKHLDFKLQFPWKIPYNLFVKAFFPKSSEEAKTTFQPYGSQLVDLFKCTRRFFTHESESQIWNELYPTISPFTEDSFQSLVLLNLLLPTWNLQKVPCWFDELFSIWSWVDFSSSWDFLIMNIYGRLLKDTYKSNSPIRKELINRFKPYLKFLFSRILSLMNLPMKNSNNVKAQSVVFGKFFQDFFVSKRMGFKMITCAKIIVYLWNDETKTNLKKFIQATKDYFHPLNTGMWTLNLSTFLLSLSSNLTKRMKIQNREKLNIKNNNNENTKLIENHLNEKEIENFILMLRPLLNMTLFSRDPLSMIFTTQTGKNLSDLNPKLIYPFIFKTARNTLKTVIHGHQNLAIIEFLNSTIVTLFSTQEVDENGFPLKLKYFPELMELTMKGIDINDIRKYVAVLMFLTHLFSCIPLIDPTNDEILGIDKEKSNTDNEEIDLKKESEKENKPNIEINFELLKVLGFGELLKNNQISKDAIIDQVFLKITSNLKHWLFIFFDKILIVISKIDKLTKKEKQFSISGLCVEQMFQQCSETIFIELLEKLKLFVTNNIYPNSIMQIGKFCSAASSANPKTTLKTFVPFFYHNLVDKCTKTENKNDQIEIELEKEEKEKKYDYKFLKIGKNKLKWYLNLLNSIVQSTGPELLNYKNELLIIINLCFRSSNKKIYKLGSLILKNAILSCIEYYPLDLRSHNKELWNNKEFRRHHWKYWGRMEFNKLKIDWHIPNKDELDFVDELLKTFLNPLLKEINEFMTNDNGNNNDNNNKNNNNNSNNNNNTEKRKKTFGIKKKINNFIKYHYGINVYFKDFNDELFNDNNNINSKILLSNSNSNVINGNSIYPKNDYKNEISNIIIKLSKHLLKFHGDYINGIKLTINIINSLINVNGISFEKFVQSKKGYKALNVLTQIQTSPIKRNVRPILIRRILYKHWWQLNIQVNLSNKTKMYSKLVSQLRKFSLNQYEQIRKTTLPYLKFCFTQSNQIFRYQMKKIFAILSNKNSNIEQIKGVLEILIEKDQVKLICGDLELFLQFMHSLCKCTYVEQEYVQENITLIFTQYYNYFQKLPLNIEAIENIESLDFFKKNKLPTLSNDLINDSKEFINGYNEYNNKIFEEYLNKFLQIFNENLQIDDNDNNKEQEQEQKKEQEKEKEKIIEIEKVEENENKKENNPKITWKFKLISSGVLNLMIKMNSNYHLKILDLYINNIKNENSQIREISILGIKNILTNFKPIIKKQYLEKNEENKRLLKSKQYFTLDNIFKSNDKNNYQDTQFYDKNWFGWNSDNLIKSEKFYIYDYKNNSNDNENKNKNKNKGINVDELKNNLQKTEFFKHFLNHMTHSQEHGKEKFRNEFAHVFKRFTQILKTDLIELIVDPLAEISNQTENILANQITVTETIAGLIRGFKHFKHEEIVKFWNEIKIFFTKSITTNHRTDTENYWNQALSFICSNRDPRRLFFIFEFYFQDLYKCTQLIFLRKLRAIEKIVYEFSWKVIGFTDYLLEIIEKKTPSASATLQSILGNLLFTTLWINTEPTRNKNETNSLSIFLQQEITDNQSKIFEMVIRLLEKGKENFQIIKQKEQLLNKQLSAEYQKMKNENKNENNNQENEKIIEDLKKKINEIAIEKKDALSFWKIFIISQLYIFLSGYNFKLSIANFIKKIISYFIQGLDQKWENQEIHGYSSHVLKLISKNSFFVPLTETGKSEVPQDILNHIFTELKNVSDWRSKKEILEFTDNFFFKNLFFMDQLDYKQNINYILALLLDKQSEIRIIAGDSLKNIVGFISTEKFQQLQTTFEKFAKIKLRKNNNALLIRKQAGVIGLGVLVNYSKYDFNKNSFQILNLLGKINTNNHIIKDTISKIFSQFFKTHEIKMLKLELSSEEMETLLSLKDDKQVESYFI
ncbi:proteasome activator complex subunit 4 [Anaeramoeba flamelloides]|uniref:Proteasome activator complex subunit 4 n=1 Tax=Anaeramoeba flamelloides TaxID=1746091 RepID=A0ABQ8X5N3_9EUKA|nr:proteasome activator complex subunit 4 [Anaeramoeba flamelloides]